MNIAIVSPWAISETSVGGTERFTIDLATQLFTLGNKVEVFVLSGTSCNIGGVKYTSLDILGEGKAANEYDLQAIVSRGKGEAFYRKWAGYLEANIDISRFDIIQLNSLLFIDAWVNKPRLITVHTNPFEYQLDWGQERFNCVVQKIQKSLPEQTLLVAPSSYYSRRFSKMLNRKVLTIPHAIDISRLSGVPKIHPKVDSDSAMERDITILLPSRLELVQKRPQIVFRGVALLPEHLRKRVAIIAAGKDLQYYDNCEKLKRIAQRAGFRAQFIKFRSMEEAYALADIVALPSKSESFGYAVLESLTLGIPTIMNSLPVFREIGAGNKNAYFFDQTAPAFSRTLLELLQDPRRYHTDETWSIRYDIQRWGEGFQKLFRGMVDNE